MKKFFKNKIGNFLGINQIKKRNDLILKNLGLINFKLDQKKNSNNINDYEFQIFSQFGEDGLILYLIDNLNIQNKTFIEFGVENYEEANTRLLLEIFNWKGLVIEANREHVTHIKQQDYFWRQKLNVANEFITKENVNEIFLNNGFQGKIGILSIDIDGNDYWIWDKINIIDPSIVIIEYNARFGKELSVTIPYEEKFNRLSNKSNLWFGASLTALYKLGLKKGYSLICTNINGNNAFFVKQDLIKDNQDIIKSQTPKECMNMNSFKELKDKNGNFINLSEKEEYDLITKLNLVEV